MNIGITAVGYVLAGFLFFIGMGLREDLGRVKEECNTSKVKAVAEAEARARAAIKRSLERQLLDLERMVQEEKEARILAEMAREEAETQAGDAQAIIRDLMRAGNEEDAPIGLACLNVDVPSDILNGMR